MLLLARLVGVRNSSTLGAPGDYSYADTILDWYELTGMTLIRERLVHWSAYTMILLAMLPIYYCGSVATWLLGYHRATISLLLTPVVWYLLTLWASRTDTRFHRDAQQRDPIGYGIAACGGPGAIAAQTIPLVNANADSDGAERLLVIANTWLSDQDMTATQKEAFDVLLGEYEGTLDELIQTVRDLER